MVATLFFIVFAVHSYWLTIARRQSVTLFVHLYSFLTFLFAVEVCYGR